MEMQPLQHNAHCASWVEVSILGAGKDSVKHKTMNMSAHLIISVTIRATWGPRQAGLKVLHVCESVGRLILLTQTSQPLHRVMCFLYLQTVPAGSTTGIYKLPIQCCVSSLEDGACVDNHNHKGHSDSQVLWFEVRKEMCSRGWEHNHPLHFSRAPWVPFAKGETKGQQMQ